MNKILIGQKTKFALEAVIVPNAELDDESIFWGDDYSHGNLFIYLNGVKFGEGRFFYPIEPTPDDASDDVIEECRNSAFMHVPAELMFSSFEFARSNNPDIDFYQVDEFSEEDINKIRDFISTEIKIDKFISNFLEQYIASDRFSNFSLGIGSYCLNRMGKFLFKHNGKVRFILKDDASSLMSDIVLDEIEYRKIWKNMLIALRKNKEK